jgi:ABC-type branched-subunit amino acid transport system substrate-binding protein
MAGTAVEELLAGLAAEKRLSRRHFLGALGGTAAGFGLAGLAAACGGGGGSSAAPSPASPFRIGVIQPQTGSLVASYKPQFVGLNMAISEINGAGGILGRQVQPVIEDDAGAAGNEPTVGRTIVDDGLTYVFGPIGSSQSLASLEATQRAKVIQCPTAADPSVSDIGKYPGSFVLTRTTAQEIAIMMNFIKATPAIRKVAVLYENTAYGQSGGQLAIQALKEKDLAPVAVEVYDQQSAALPTSITRIKNAGADAIVNYSSIAPDAITAIKTMINLEFHPYLMNSSQFMITIVSTLPKDVKIPPDFLAKMRTPTYTNFMWEKGKQLKPKVQKYLVAVRDNPDSGASKFSVATSGYYDFLHILKNVVESVKSFDYAKVRKGLEGVKDYDGVLGKISFSPNSHLGISPDDFGMGVINDLTAPESLGFLPMKG